MAADKDGYAIDIGSFAASRQRAWSAPVKRIGLSIFNVRITAFNVPNQKKLYTSIDPLNSGETFSLHPRNPAM